MNKSIFSLDIGTRSVTGILLDKQEDHFIVTDHYVKEHTERAMLDGQIHDIVSVSNVITEVKEKLEKTAGQLTHVNAAAAGRALKTVQATASIQLNEQPITSLETIKHLELSAVQKAQSNLIKLDKEQKYSTYYCVGYSIVYYKLDDEKIGSLIDQIGETASVEVIATFLPKVVVESLLAALNRSNLSMEALTLEPIAAIHVLIPESMRRLNVALIDIGAGTSDIAITNKGTVTAYGMTPTAGDEITEAMSDHYLLDFSVAEEAKREVVNNGQCTVEDILGFETSITYNDLVKNIQPQIEKLTSSLAEEIIRLNKRPPKAIMLIGGGSLTPEISNTLANRLELPENRVAVRGLDAIKSLHSSDHLPAGPDFVTPIGIAITAKQNPIHYTNVTVNNVPIRMFEMKQLTISDCLIQAGIEINKYYGKPGLAAIITLNGKRLTIPGELGQPPIILLNNEVKNVDSDVTDHDEIAIQKGADGLSANITLKELVGELQVTEVYLNDRKHKLNSLIYVNGREEKEQYIVQDRDEITINQQHTVKDLLTNFPEKDTMKPFTLFVNDREIQMKDAQTIVFVNNNEVNLNEPLYNKDRVHIVPAINPTVKDLLQQQKKDYWHQIDVKFNQQLIHMKQQLLSVFRNHIELQENSELMRNDHIYIEKNNLNPFIFQDVFRYTEIDLTKASGGFKLYNNNEPTTFYDTIKHNDELAIKWEK